MEALYPQDWRSYLSILAVFLRVTGLFVLMPAVSHKAIPNRIRIMFAVAFTLALYPIVKPFVVAIPESLGGLVLVAIRETVIGFLVGFATYLAFEAIHVGAQFIGFQMGFGVGGMMDPQLQSTVTVMVPFYSWLILMVFFIMNLHHEILALFVASFKLTHSVNDLGFQNPAVFKSLVEMSGTLFVVAVKMAAPFTLLILACNASMGILSRTMPQMNLLLLSFPITILLGFATLYLVAPEMLEFIEGALGEVSDSTVRILRAL